MSNPNSPCGGIHPFVFIYWQRLEQFEQMFPNSDCMWHCTLPKRFSNGRYQKYIFWLQVWWDHCNANKKQYDGYITYTSNMIWLFCHILFMFFIVFRALQSWGLGCSFFGFSKNFQLFHWFAVEYRTGWSQ